MISIKVAKWDGARAAGQVKGLAYERVARAVVFFWRSCQQALSISNPRPYRTPSRPGEPPRLRTGHGRSQVQYTIDREAGEGRVGVGQAGRYMAYLELGTSRVQARPWLLATLRKVESRLKAIAEGGS